MTHGVIDRLKVVEIHIDQGKRHILVRKDTDQKIHTVGDLHAVRKSCDRVEVVHLVETFLVLLHRTVIFLKKRILALRLFFSLLKIGIGLLEFLGL